MRKPLRTMTLRDCKNAIEGSGEVRCPMEKANCAYKHYPFGIEYGNLGELTRWPVCENCGCELAVEWENYD